jgi:glyoxylase-like metal-dependent hydrolase (beta-lactamase superfamily II)
MKTLDAGRPYRHIVLQEGSLPLTPEGRVVPSVEHRATSVLLWPGGQSPTRENTVMTDPCFTFKGLRRASAELRRLGLRLSDVGYFFVTHPHADHALEVPGEPRMPTPVAFADRPAGTLPGLDTIPCPGHMASLHALVFRSPEDVAVWVVGDAILDLEWLRAWGFYWPNGYSEAEIVETWRSTAKILAGADVVIPGHGGPFSVTAPLIAELLKKFPGAPSAARCPDVAGTLEGRRMELEERERR